jgi:fructokinase
VKWPHRVNLSLTGAKWHAPTRVTLTRFGIDLGGTKTEIVGLDESGGEVLRRRVSTPKDDYRGTLDMICSLVRDAETASGSRGSVGIGTPGSLSPNTGLLRGSNSVCLNGKPIKTDLEALLGREVRIANDANCFALSEATDGAGRDADVVFGAILGTGVGSGIVVRGRVLSGPNAIAGEWGHNPLPWPEDDERPGPGCFCGQRGCIETFLSGPALERDHLAVTGQRAIAQEIALKSSKADPGAAATMLRYERRLAKALAHVINLLDPDVIVLGGGLSNAERLYRNVPAHWSRYVYSDSVTTPLLKAKHGDASGVRGAARLW